MRTSSLTLNLGKNNLKKTQTGIWHFEFVEIQITILAYCFKVVSLTENDSCKKELKRQLQDFSYLAENM